MRTPIFLWFVQHVKEGIVIQNNFDVILLLTTLYKLFVFEFKSNSRNVVNLTDASFFFV